MEESDIFKINDNDDDDYDLGFSIIFKLSFQFISDFYGFLVSKKKIQLIGSFTNNLKCKIFNYSG